MPSVSIPTVAGTTAATSAATAASAASAAAATAAGAAASTAGAAAAAGVGTAAGVGSIGAAAAATPIVSGAAASSAITGSSIFSLSNISAVGGVGSSAISVYQQQQAMNAQKAQAQLVAERQNLETVRNSRATYARAQQASVNQGVGTSSAAQGGQASIISQTQGELGYLHEYDRLSQSASNAISSSRLFGAAAGLGETIFKNADYISNTANDIFGTG